MLKKGDRKMKANEKKFLQFLEGSNKHFVIPIYQRNYDWKQEQCKQLFNDIIDVSKTKRTHFLGSIVSIYHDDGDDLEYLIIDGQQRLTTLSLLLLALFKIIDNNELEANVTKEQIRDEYLINKYSKDEKKIRLKPIHSDKNAFSALFESKDDYILNTNITINFQYFYKRILENKISVDELFSAIKRLVIVDIELKRGEDDPQLIFESLNSTGLDLTEADKVRNFVLMKEKSSTQDFFYKTYWNKIEQNTNHRVSNFIRDYLTIKERKIPNKNKVYLEFKNYAISNKIAIEDLLIDLLKYSKYYKKIINLNQSVDKISLLLNKINRLESIVSYPFIMEVFDDEREKIINENDVESILLIVINFVYRRLICDVPSNALNKIFMVMARDIKKYEDYKDNYLEIFKYIITQKKLSQRFPNDEEFSERIVKKDIYNFQSKNRLFLLEQLENHNNKERVDVENLLDSNDLTIEHIMPQMLTSSWKKSLGADYEIIHQKYLHTIGNITLTGYNSEMKNKPFIEKKTMSNGFENSHLFLNQSLSKVNIWREEEIFDRANILKERALEIWTYPSSTYTPIKNIKKIFTLGDDDKNFSGERIKSFILDSQEKNIGSWKEFYREISHYIYKSNQLEYNDFIKVNKYDYNGIKIEKDSFKLGEFNIYTNLSVETILSRLRKLLDYMEIDLDNITFEIK
jgi:uncharacterized protein with ParB-like and HNH nuclease domain